MKKTILTIALAMSISFLFAQGAIDALRYSTTTFNGDARYMGMSGAFGALGANTSVLSTNPAGMGLYKSSDFSVTTSFMDTKIDANYNGTATQDSRFNFSLNNIAVVFTNDYLNIRPSGYWKNFQFGFGFNQIKNFNRRIYISGDNSANSISDMYAAMAQGINFQDIEDDSFGDYAFDLNPAWWTFLISQDGNEVNAFEGADPQGGVLQSKVIESWGYMNEFSMAFSANYADRFYIGASIGMPIINYHEQSTYEEEALLTNIADDTYRKAEISETLSTEGVGFNLKLGMIYRATDALRFGFAVHTPTYYPGLKDDWSRTFKTYWDVHDQESKASPLGQFSYDLSTPMRLIGSVAYVIGKVGLISADFEYVDYAAAKLSGNSYSFRDENDEIRSIYTSTSNIRLGTEWRAMNFTFRGGFAYYGSPFADNGNDASIKSYSLGFGYRERSFYTDIAWVYSEKSEDQYLYGFGAINANPATSKTMNSTFLLTFGVRF